MLNLTTLAIPAFAVLLIVEAAFDTVMRRELYEIKDTAASIAMGIGNVLIGLGSKAMAFALFSFVNRFAIFEIGHQWWAWALLFLGDDLTFYIFHSTSHKSRFLWASHVVHHSSQRYNLGTALRQTWTGELTKFPFWLWLPLVGFKPIMVVMMPAISLIYQFWIHTQVVGSLGPLEKVLNTPSHHRVHHACNARYIDRNHGGVLIIWDRLFGTFEPESSKDKPVYGLTKNIHSYNPLRIAFHEWADLWHDLCCASSLRDKVRCIFGPPGRDYVSS